MVILWKRQATTLSDDFVVTTEPPELVFGLVGPLGTDLHGITKSLSSALGPVGYQAQRVRLSHLRHDLDREPWSELKSQKHYDIGLAAHMKAGNCLREATRHPAAMAFLAVGSIRALRNKNSGAEKRAYILHSLKRPEEVELLRTIYGSAFFLVAAYAPEQRRIDQVARTIASSRSGLPSEYLDEATRLVNRDEHEIGDTFGQNTRDTFAVADAFVNATVEESTNSQLKRFVELIFNHPFHTPTADEQGMYLAQGAAYRSASLARQVGAAICRKDRSLLSIGCNEVARAKGGQYWEDDDPDERDFRLGYDTSDRMKRRLLTDILDRLKGHEWLSKDVARIDTSELVRRCLDGDAPFMKGADFLGTIDYVRAVHAEMSALTDAARNGVETRGSILYCTTFPCHDCAKHIVAAGVERVVYIEPYPKSLVKELHKNCISVDEIHSGAERVPFEPFVGIAPNRYSELFLAMTDRKDRSGNVTEWDPESASPKLPAYAHAGRGMAEKSECGTFFELMREAGLFKSAEDLEPEGETNEAIEGLG